MRLGFIAALVIAPFVFTQAQGNSAQQGPVYKSAAELESEILLKPGQSAHVTPVAVGEPGQLTQIMRNGPGPSEIHTDKEHEHLWVTTAGEATITMGGVLEDKEQSETRSSDWFGSKITGGRTVVVKPGDIVFIPAGTPHQVVPRGTVTFLAISRK